MFDKIKGFFTGEQSFQDTIGVTKEGNPVDQVLQVATVVLLMEIAGRDKKIERTEAEVLCDTVSKEFNISDDDIPALVEVAIAARKETDKIDEFVNNINEQFSEEQRIRILAMIWKVVIADGQVDKFEDRFATEMKFRFKLNDDQALEAMQLAEAGRI